MKQHSSKEKQLEYLQKRLRVSKEYIMETCRISKVSLEKIIDYLENNRPGVNRFALRV